MRAGTARLNAHLRNPVCKTIFTHHPRDGPRDSNNSTGAGFADDVIGIVYLSLQVSSMSLPAAKLKAEDHLLPLPARTQKWNKAEHRAVLGHHPELAEPAADQSILPVPG